MPEVSHWHHPDRRKVCILCDEEKPLSEFSSYRYTTKQGKRSTRYESRCKPCGRKRRMEQYVANRDAEIARMLRWRENNPERQELYAKNYRASEHGRRIKAKCQRLRKARARAGVGDTAEIREIYEEAMRVEQVISCCPIFDDPILGKKIHVDHILPLAKDGKHVIKNLQLLPIGINMRKGISCPR